MINGLDDFYLIGEVKSIYGPDGSVIIKSFSDFADRFFELERVVIDYFGKTKELEIEFAKETNNLLIFKFRRFNNEDDVLFLIGKKLYVSKENLFKLPDDTIYIHDLIDCEIYKDSLFFGKLIDVLSLPNNDVYVIEKNDGNEVMIPAVKKYIKKIVPEEKKIFLSIESEIFE